MCCMEVAPSSITLTHILSRLSTAWQGAGSGTLLVRYVFRVNGSFESERNALTG
jgi:hypothetical protein